MSENKRFKVKGFDEYDQMVWDTEFEESCSIEQVVNMLNDKDWVIDTLNEENEQLKSVNMEYEDALGRLEEENDRLKKALLFYLDIAITESSSNFQNDFDKWCNLLFNCNHEEAKRKYGDFEYNERWELDDWK